MKSANGKKPDKYVSTSDALEQLPTELSRVLLLTMMTEPQRAWTMLDLFGELNKGCELEPKVPLQVIWMELAILASTNLMLPTFHIKASNLVKS